MSLGWVSARFLVGVGAWLLGAGAATGGSLLAVSLLGQSLAPAGTQQLTSAAVSQALASAAPDSASATPTSSPSPTPTPTPTPTPKRRHHRAKPAAPATPTAAAQPTTTVLSSAGGSVVAECQAAGAYLVSWNPNSGYQVAHETRGPAAKAKVTFSTYSNNSIKVVTMVITCANGVPSANTTVSYHDE